MVNPFTAKEVPSKTQAELDARATVTSINDWFATRTNWAHIQSFCNKCSDNVRIMTSFKNPIQYIGGSYSGLRPEPIIESIQVKGQGNLGTTRQATVKIIAFTQEQVNALSACYGVPSMSVRVQFGWNKGATKTASPAPLETELRNSKAVCAMNKARDKTAVYDGLQGLVGNWGVSFNSANMWWEFTIEIIAESSPVLALPLEDFTTQCYCDRVSQDPSTGEAKTESQGTSPFRAKILDYVKRAPDNEASMIEEGVYSIHLNHAERDELGNAAGGFMNMLSSIAASVGINTEETDEAYITFGALEKLVNRYSFSQVNGEPLMSKFDSSKFGLLSYKAPGYSSDPDICLFPGLDKKYYDGLDGIQNAGNCLVDGGIDIQKVLINCIYVNQCIENSGKNASLQDFFEKIFNGMNQAAAGMFELSIVDDGNCDDGGGQTATLSAIDLQKIKGLNKGYPIPIGPTKAVARDVKFDLKQSDAMKSQALYGGIRNNASSAPCDTARFEKELTGPKDNTIKVTKADPPKGDCPDDCKTKADHEADKPTILDDYQDMVDDTTAAAKETVRSRLVEVYNKNASKDLCANVMLPYEFSFTVDGVGGFAFGQLVTCTLLPSDVQKRLAFQVTSVEHSVTYGDWTTTVNTKARYLST